MLKYLLRRLGFLILTLLITSMVIFIVTQFLPGDVARVILGREAGEAALEALREELGLKDPLPVQYTRWLVNFIRGDWGKSYSTKTEIRPLVLGRLRNSLMLAAVILVISVPLAILLGVIAGLNENKFVDNVISIASLAVVGLPEFVTGLVLIQIFSFRLKLFPANSSIRPTTSFIEALPMLILPAMTATLVLLAYIARLTRAGVIEELKQQYVRTADLKGLPRRTVIFKHVLRNALIPTITVVAISMGWLISGLIVIENVFNYPGLGRLMVFAIDRRDLPLLQAVTMVAVLGFALSNLVADILYAILDPRIRLG
ncbi:MAG: ABC transporter permease [Anaerolineales bacterium]|nr:ABC transporter permease [Anaerolineales bacterium]MCS7249198.1 ABC transporter permease [Anaerolineales bacterium]MDW8163011.1 ABC transporter permease [Anaerolineales bacterium]MDW8446098.1 ABC transporter permease [Anaerolineales bacterium]